MEEYIKKVAAKTKDQKGVIRPPGSQDGHVPLSLIIFNKYDADKDGTLSFEEFRAFTVDKGYFFSTSELVNAFSLIDENEDGEISYDEFQKFWSDDERFMHMLLSPKQQKQVELIFEVFAYFDESKDGLLEADEFKNLFAMMKQKGFNLFGKPEETFKKIDINGDGHVEFAELLRFFVEKHGILNTDDVEQP